MYVLVQVEDLCWFKLHFVPAVPKSVPNSGDKLANTGREVVPSSTAIELFGVCNIDIGSLHIMRIYGNMRRVIVDYALTNYGWL